MEHNRHIQEAWDMGDCREVLMGEILSGEEKRHQIQENILKAADYAATVMPDMVYGGGSMLKSQFFYPFWEGCIVLWTAMTWSS